MYPNFLDPYNYLKPGDVVECYFLSKCVIGSFGLAVLGSLIAVELLTRKTSSKGLYNWILTVLAAFFMSAVGIWSMHYLADILVFLCMLFLLLAIDVLGTMMGWGDASYQVVQSPLICMTTFIVPFLGLIAAYYLIGGGERPSTKKVVSGAILAGIVSTGDHLLGQLGITNYDLTYAWSVVLGSAGVSIIVNIWVFLSLMHVRRHFQTRWYRQIFFAICLATSTSGMHWIAMLGTSHIYVKDPNFSKNYHFRNVAAAIVACMAAFAGFVVILFVVCGRRRDTCTKNATNRILLTSATFTYDGRIMLKPDGTLPSQVICRNHDDRTFDDLLECSHPVFQWMTRVSLNWISVIDILNVMRFHTKEIERKEDPDRQYWDDRTFNLYFRERFALAANKLATSIKTPLENLGSLHEEVYSIGTPFAYKEERYRKQEGDVEKKTIEVKRGARGRMMTISRTISPEQAKLMEPLGYRFSPIESAVQKLAWSTQTTTDKISLYLNEVKRRCFSEYTSRLESGVYIGCFAIRPTMAGRFDVCVERGCPAQIPMKRINVDGVTKKQSELMQSLDGAKLSQLLPLLNSKLEHLAPEEVYFLQELSKTLQLVCKEIHGTLWKHSTLMGSPVLFPCKTSTLNTKMTGEALAFGLCTVLPIHEDTQNSLKYDFLPYTFVNTLQKTFATDIAHFALLNSREFLTKARDAYQEKEEEMRARKNSLTLFLSRTLSHPRKVSIFHAEIMSKKPSPLMVPLGGTDWDPEIPEEFETKDHVGWLEQWFKTTTDAARAKGVAAPARFGAR